MTRNKIKMSKICKYIASISLFFLMCIIIFFIYIYNISDIKKVNEEIEKGYSTSVLDSNGELLDVFLDEEEQWHLKTEDDIPKNLKEAVLAYEDKNFYKHHGVDVLAVLRALKNNFTGKKRSGASTITMQVAKLSSPKERSYYNKIKEIIFSFKLESKLEKEDIIKMYLNNAPYGGNIVGYGTASRLYFRKVPKNLSWSECALLAVLPNSPGAMNVEKNRDKLVQKRNVLLEKLYRKGLFNKQLLELSKREPLPDGKYPFERVTPHLSRRLFGSCKEKVIRTTIDGNMQKRMMNVVKSYSNYTRSEGILNISVLIIENKTRDVKVYIGSQDFMDMKDGGQVDGIIAKRSPGSILKPFLYGLSIDEGLVAPQSLVQDVPMYFSNFNPQNASKKYTGMIEIRQALIMSLNIPFVHLLQQYGEERFFYFLKNVTGFQENEPSKYGLSLILGTKEFSPEEIGELYSGLANYGNFKKLNYLMERKNEESGKKLLSDGASYLTLDTLMELRRPGLNNMYKWKDPISWKTGTSFGRRDAWACGVTPDYTVIVWVGNFSGKSNDNLSGVISGGRLLFNVFQELSINNKRFAIPYNDMETIEVDKMTGYRIDLDGIEKKRIMYPKSAKPLKISPYYKKIYVNDNDEEIDSRDPNFFNSKEKIVMNYPLEVVNYFIRENRDVSQIYNLKTKKKSLKIIYPTPNLRILLPKDLDKEQNVIVKIANLKKQNIYWYLDKEFIGKEKDFEKELPMSIGEHTITIMSEDGELERVKFKIEKTY